MKIQHRKDNVGMRGYGFSFVISSGISLSFSEGISIGNCLGFSFQLVGNPIDSIHIRACSACFAPCSTAE